jgi:hypothetical protein
MTRLTPILALTLMIGCATRQPVVATRQHAEPAYARSASALCFDPPVARYAPVARYEVPLDLSRDGREAAAFAGYQQQLTTFYSSFTDDRQSTGYYNGLNSYNRRTLSLEVGTMTR